MHRLPLTDAPEHRSHCGRCLPLSAQPSLLAQDVAEAQGKISDSLLQRLILKPQKIAQLAQGIRAIAAQEEPIRRVLQRTEVAEGVNVNSNLIVPFL